MTTTLSTVARAFQLARSGTCPTLEDLRKTLKAERYEFVDGHLSSGSLTRQLRALVKGAKATVPASSSSPT